MRPLARNISIGFGIAFASLILPSQGATMFTEDFSSNTAGPNMALGTGFGTPTTSFASGNFTITSGQNSRIYLGTNDTDYSTVNFVFTATITIPGTNAWSSAMFGMGNPTPLGGTNQFGEPLTTPNLYMLVRPDTNKMDSRDNATIASGSPPISLAVAVSTSTSGLRMTWNATTKQALFEVDSLNNGSYDQSFTLDGSNNGFTSSNSRLFIGGGNGLIVDNISIIVQAPSGPVKITSIIKSETVVTVGFEGVAGLTYDLNKSLNLDFTTPNIAETITLSGTTIGTLKDINASEPAAFYRVQQR